jgi:hypothetical protein
VNKPQYSLNPNGPQYPGDPVFACYAVPGPGYVDLELWHFTAQTGFNAYSGYDDGTGGCGFLGYVGLDQGWRAFTIYYTYPDGHQDQYTTYYYASYGGVIIAAVSP